MLERPEVERLRRPGVDPKLLHVVQAPVAPTVKPKRTRKSRKKKQKPLSLVEEAKTEAERAMVIYAQALRKEIADTQRRVMLVKYVIGLFTAQEKE